MSSNESGIVKWFNNRKGYGFIQRADGADVFVHYRHINGEGYRTLHEGQRVAYTLIEGDKGLQAESVSVIE